MKILLATNHLIEYSGSEITLFTILKGLKRLKHDVDVTSVFNNTDILKKFDREKYNYVDIDNKSDIKYDVAYVQHNSAAILVRYLNPKLPIVLAHLGPSPFLEQPPNVEIGAYCHLAISEEVQNNLIKNHNIPKNKILIFRNIVDEEQFYPERTLPSSPKSVLIYSNRMSDEQRHFIMQVCDKLGMSCELLGGKYGQISQQELRKKINAHDIVFSLGRGVIETMLCGKIPIVFDYLGGDGMVTPKHFHTMATTNFSGRLKGKFYTSEELEDEFLKYNSNFGRELRDLSIQAFGLKRQNELFNKVIRKAAQSNKISFDRKGVRHTAYLINNMKNFQIKTLLKSIV